MNTEQILEQIFDNGYAIKDVEIGKKLKIRLKNLTAQDYIDIDPLLVNTKNTKLFVLQTYGLAKLSRALVSYNGIKFSSVEEAHKQLKALPAVLIDKLLKEHTEFEKEVAEAFSPENIEENFFDETGLAEKLEQSPKDLTSDSQED